MGEIIAMTLWVLLGVEGEAHRINRHEGSQDLNNEGR